MFIDEMYVSKFAKDKTVYQLLFSPVTGREIEFLFSEIPPSSEPRKMRKLFAPAGTKDNWR